MKTLQLFLLMFCLSACQSAKKEMELQNNAIWVQSIFLRGHHPSTGVKLSESMTKSLARQLNENNIEYAYLFAGPYDSTGHLPAYGFSSVAQNSIRELKQYCPDLKILPWVGGVQNRTVFLDDSLWVKNAINDTRRLIETLSVPGVHVDLEFMLRGDPYLDQFLGAEKPGDLESYGENVNEFHRRLRLELPQAFISSVVTATPAATKPWKRKTSLEELKVLIRYIDQLSFLFYDTSIKEQGLFIESCVALLEDIRALKESGQADIQYLVAIGTFINEPALHKYRDLNVENVSNSINTIKQAQDRVSKDEDIVDGIAIYCDWETDESEWNEFAEAWLK